MAWVLFWDSEGHNPWETVFTQPEALKEKAMHAYMWGKDFQIGNYVANTKILKWDACDQNQRVNQCY